MKCECLDGLVKIHTHKDRVKSEEIFTYWLNGNGKVVWDDLVMFNIEDEWVDSSRGNEKRKEKITEYISTPNKIEWWKEWVDWSNKKGHVN